MPKTNISHKDAIAKVASSSRIINYKEGASVLGGAEVGIGETLTVLQYCYIGGGERGTCTVMDGGDMVIMPFPGAVTRYVVKP